MVVWRYTFEVKMGYLDEVQARRFNFETRIKAVDMLFLGLHFPEYKVL